MKNPSKGTINIKIEKLSATQIQQSKLNKTQSQKPTDNFENTYYAQNNKPIESKPSSQQLPPRAGSSQKINYKVAENMTNSKIQEAKKGLALLKKKMSRNGLSR